LLHPQRMISLNLEVSDFLDEWIMRKGFNADNVFHVEALRNFRRWTHRFPTQTYETIKTAQRKLNDFYESEQGEKSQLWIVAVMFRQTQMVTVQLFYECV
jgi:hypothetical protein